MIGQTLRAAFERTTTRLKEDARTRNGVLFLLGGFIAAIAPLIFTSYGIEILMQLFIIVLLVGSWIFIAGYFGIFTFAHVALYGVGAYAAVLVVGELGVPPLISILIAGLAAGVFCLPIAYPVLRLKGAYVGMVTLAYAEIIYRGTIILRDVTGGPTGYTSFSPLFGGDQLLMYYFVVGIVVLLMGVQYGFLVNRFGLVARAIRESEEAAEMLGNNVPRYKLSGFIIGSAIAGVAGALQAYTLLIISPPMLQLSQMIEVMAMGIIGGPRMIGGAIFGGVAVFGLSEMLRDVGEVRLIIWGALLVIVTLFFPNGLAGSDFGIQSRFQELFDR
ncbi:branched-chain amino acid ABC transporter permease [Haladaptatus salinisoli]|uniref:branched-chain amino acid ABC transporter permease n=1 Tax=Haladaptatus salinisoli TaxID=2884876 RepID=UPI001D09C3E6|nr:branched-chain amino acid ABC transporter permease [Haladaptatus salinisoli]